MLSAHAHAVRLRLNFVAEMCRYMARLRHSSAQLEVLSIFEKTFGFTSVRRDRSKAEELIAAFMEQKLGKDLGGDAAAPVVLTERLKYVWRQLVHEMRVDTPILLVGAEGCGKSEAVRALASMTGHSIEQCALTPETEPTTLIGTQVPNDREGTADKPEPRIKWQDGVVTRAFKSGEWTLLDNLNQAEASVLERMNALLESPAGPQNWGNNRFPTLRKRLFHGTGA